MADASFRDTLREEILHKAGLIIETEGVQALQARRIAREAGCAVGTLYNLFGDIDGLIIAVNAETLAMLGAAVASSEELADRLCVRERLERLGLAYMQFAMANERRWEAVFKHRLVDGRAVPSSYLEDQARLLAVIEAAIAHWIEDAQEREATARALFGAVHGIVALALDNRLGGRAKADLESQIRLIVRLTSRGIRDGGAKAIT